MRESQKRTPDPILFCISPMWDLIAPQTQTRGVPARLNEKERATFEKNLAKIDRKIRNGKCREFLESVFGELIADGILNALNSQQAFSGPRSSGITIEEAGIYSRSDIENFRTQAQSSDPAVAARYTGYLTQTVADWFANRNGQGGRKTGAVVGNYNGNPNTVFYRSFKWQKMLHEALHVTTGLGDDELAAALGIDITKFGGDSQLSSDAINKRLKEMGCK